MTARQQILSAKVPRYVAFYFKKDNTTGIATTTNITTGMVESGCDVKCKWNGEEVEATVIALSNSRAELDAAIESYVPEGEASEPEPQSEPTVPQPQVHSTSATSVSKATNRNSRKKDPKTGGAQTLDSGSPASETQCTTPVHAAAFVIDEEVRSLVDGHDGQRVTKGSQAVVSMINNSTQTEPDYVEQLVEKLMTRINQLESNIEQKFDNVSSRLGTLESTCGSSSVSNIVSDANACLNDPYNFDDDSFVRTPSRVFSTPTNRRTPIQSMQREMKEPGFWNLTPVDILGKDEGTIIEAAKERSLYFEPELTSDIIEEVKGNSENQRHQFAKNLVNHLFTLRELYNKT